METTYTMIGADGQQYGPISLAQLKSWAGEGRISGETKILRSDTKSWLPAAQYPELGLSPSTPPAIQGSPAAASADLTLVRRVRSGARWFFWIAVLSLVNSFGATGHGMVFIAGLASTRLAGALVPDPLGMVLSILIPGIFVLLGVFAWKRHSWSFIAGMALYAADGLLLIAWGAGLEIAFHLFVLFWLFLGLRANLQLKAATAGRV